MKKIILMAVAASSLLFTGCQQFVRSAAQAAAEEPYRKAMLQGQMAPSEYKQQQEEIRKAAELGK